MKRIGIDVGGTNTDAALLSATAVLATAKAPSTADTLTGVVRRLEQLRSNRDDGTCDQRVTQHVIVPLSALCSLISTSTTTAQLLLLLPLLLQTHRLARRASRYAGHHTVCQCRR
jgi:N-methylhydantoinase A/oxoprolinase/acetone carboxylase beta subunit